MTDFPKLPSDYAPPACSISIRSDFKLVVSVDAPGATPMLLDDGTALELLRRLVHTSKAVEILDDIAKSHR